MFIRASKQCAFSGGIEIRDIKSDSLNPIEMEQTPKMIMLYCGCAEKIQEEQKFELSVGGR
jgi:hypothetical protein